MSAPRQDVRLDGISIGAAVDVLLIAVMCISIARWVWSL